MSVKKQTSALQLAQKEPDQSSESQLPVKCVCLSAKDELTRHVESQLGLGVVRV